jgi:hypothetical protein
VLGVEVCAVVYSACISSKCMYISTKDDSCIKLNSAARVSLLDHLQAWTYIIKKK